MMTSISANGCDSGLARSGVGSAPLASDVADLQRRLDIVRLSHAVCRACLTAPDLGVALTACAELVARALQAPFVGIWTRSAEGSALELRGAAGNVAAECLGAKPEAISISGGTLVGRVAIEGKPLFLSDAPRNAFGVSVEVSQGFGGVPIMHVGRSAGVLAIAMSPPIDSHVQAILQAVAAEIAQNWERLASEVERRRERQRLQALEKLSAVAAICLDADQRVTRWSPVAERLFGWPAQQALGQRIPLISPPARSRFEICLDNAWRGRRTENVELIAQRWDGHAIEVQVSATPVLDCAGEVEQVAILITDRSHENAIDRGLKAQVRIASALAASPSLALAALSVLQVIAECFDWRFGEFWQAENDRAAWKCIAVWPAVEAGKAPMDMSAAGDSLALDADLPGAVRRERSVAWFANSAESMAAQRASAALHGNLHEAIGVPLVVDAEVVGVLLFYAFEIGKPSELVAAALTGIAAQMSQFVLSQRIASALREVEDNHRQSQKMEAVGQLAGGIAHDFNNLLTIILGHSEIALERLPSDSPLTTFLQEIAKAGHRAAGLTRQLLAFSRKQVLEPVVLDLNAIIEDMDAMLRRLIGERIQLETMLADGLHYVLADRGQIEQVLLNLVVNARDAMPEGGRVSISTRNESLQAQATRSHPDARPGDYAALAVADAGCGMDPQTLAHIFEPFFTTKSKGKGTGMGLSTVFGIVQQSGGFLTVDSEVGKGTTFTVFLPRSKRTLLTMKVESPVAQQPNGVESILLVEDEDAVRMLIAHVLEARGYTVLQAADGEQALELQSQHPTIDLLLTDVVMPGMSGPQLAHTMFAARPGLKTLFMSGYTDAEEFKEPARAGQQLLHKPFTSAQLANKVRQILDL